VHRWDPLSKDFSFTDPADFARAHLPTHFFDRYFYAEKVGDSSSLQDKAKEKFEANILRGWIFNSELSSIDDPWLNSVLSEAALICGRVLGELDHTEVFAECGHGPNATTSVRKNDAYLDIKTMDFVGTDAAVETFFEHYLPWDSNLKTELGRLLPSPEKVGRGYTIVGGDKLSFVPKKFDSLRTMSVQPTLNLFFQLGTGRLIQRLLRDFANIDLTSQPDCHRRLALLASLYPEIGDATIDWSEASDRIWLAICERLLPGDWYAWLSMMRVDESIFGEDTYPLPMIGTMGNGFTFPLQTLIFYSLLRGCARTEGVREIGISVFGDDCIVPAVLKSSVERLAIGLGWKINVDKSYFDGGFRESCGMDAYRGLACRPFRIERPDDPHHKNSLKSWAYVCYNQVAACLESVHAEPSAIWDWLVAFHNELDLGKVLLVPLHFSDATGIRWSRHKEIPSEALAPRFDKHGGASFRCLTNDPGRRDAWYVPWYLAALAQRPLPEDTWCSHLVGEASAALIWSKEDQVEQCPVKRKRYRSRESTVQSWTVT
jgi:hypothetical protein